MSVTSTRAGFAMVLAAILSVAAHGQADDPTTALIQKAAAYVKEYERRLSSVVCEERQTQLVVRPDGTTSKRRELVSDLLIVKVGDSILSFRDVLAVDGKPVRDRQTRLRKLFLESKRAPLEQARKVASESARYNIGGRRQLDPLMLALGIVLHYGRSQFRFTRTADGVSFEEEKRPFQGQQVPARRETTSKMWIHGGFALGPDGRVLSSSFSADNADAELTVDVRYGEEPTLHLLLPVQMREQYRTPSRPKSDTTDVSSSYAACRQFQVSVDEQFEIPK